MIHGNIGKLSHVIVPDVYVSAVNTMPASRKDYLYTAENLIYQFFSSIPLPSFQLHRLCDLSAAQVGSDASFLVLSFILSVLLLFAISVCVVPW